MGVHAAAGCPLDAACPFNLTCRKGGEYFTRAWLAAAGADGPLADMFVTQPTVPVHADRAGNPYGAIYCADPAGADRTLFRLDDLQGLAVASSEVVNGAASSAQTATTATPPSISLTTTVNSARLLVSMGIIWSSSITQMQNWGAWRGCVGHAGRGWL